MKGHTYSKKRKALMARFGYMPNASHCSALLSAGYSRAVLDKDTAFGRKLRAAGGGRSIRVKNRLHKINAEWRQKQRST